MRTVNYAVHVEREHISATATADKNLYLDTHVPLISIRLDRTPWVNHVSMFRNATLAVAWHFDPCELSATLMRRTDSRTPIHTAIIYTHIYIVASRMTKASLRIHYRDHHNHCKCII